MGDAVVSRFTTAQLARILDLPPSEIRRWVRTGLLRRARGEGRSASFDFRDVATSRAVAALTRAGVSTRRLKRSMRQIGEWLPGADDVLPRLEAAGDGGGVRVRLRSGEAAEPSGQLLLDFAAEVDGARPAEERIVELRPQSGSGGRPGTEALPDPDGAEAWFDAGVHADEAGAHEQAVDAYSNRRSSAVPTPPRSTTTWATPGTRSAAPPKRLPAICAPSNGSRTTSRRGTTSATR